jgi:FMN phosphatase YigB (HAD superfamily)
MPNPAAYRAALHALELPAERMAFVGHKGDELSGAAALGMSTIAFNSDIDALADVYLDRFEDLAKVASRRLPCAAAG